MDPEKEIKFEKPKGDKGPSSEPEIHVMPKKFRGVTVSAKIPEVSTAAPSKAKPPELKRPVSKKIKAPAAPKDKKGFPWLIIVIIAVVLVALGASVAFVLWGLQTPAEPADEVAVIEEPTPVMPADEEPEVVEPEEVDMATDEEVLPASPEETIPASPEETIPAAEEEEEPVPAVVLTPGVDADSDGLTDLEEELYGTDISRPDTDSDGYLDGNEVYHLYNPGGTAPVTLLESGLVNAYNNPDYDYRIYFPASWDLDLAKGTSLVMFSAEQGEFVQVLIEENPQDISLVEWYLTQSPGTTEDELKTFTNKAGHEGLQSPDRLTAYFKRNSTIYVISFNAGSADTIEYRRTYEMMLNSFDFLND
jgi:hypothetical protein